MEPSLLLTLIVAGGWVGMYMYRRSGRWMVRRTARKAPFYSIEAFPEGQRGKVAGKVTYYHEPLTAPLSGRPCAYYHIKVEAGRGNKKAWIISEHNGRDFLVEDHSGSALVAVSKALCLVSSDYEETSDGVLTKVQADLLRRHGEIQRGWHFVSYTEAIIQEGREIVAAGHGTREPTTDPTAFSDYRGTPMRLTIGSTPDKPLVLSDDAVLLAKCRQAASSAEPLREPPN